MWDFFGSVRQLLILEFWKLWTNKSIFKVAFARVSLFSILIQRDETHGWLCGNWMEWSDAKIIKILYG